MKEENMEASDTKSISARMTECQIVLPKPPPAVGNYVGARRIGNLVYVSGQLPIVNGQLMRSGCVDSASDIPEAYQAARMAALNALAQAAAVVGSVDGIASVIRVGGFVLTGSDFFDAPKVVNGASDLFVEIFGDAGRHCRAAVGVASLPGNASVEIEATFEVWATVT